MVEDLQVLVQDACKGVGEEQVEGLVFGGEGKSQSEEGDCHMPISE